MSTVRFLPSTAQPVPAESLVTPDNVTIAGAGIVPDPLRIDPAGAAAAIAPFLPPPPPPGPPDPTALAYTFEDFETSAPLVAESGGPGQHTGSVYLTGNSVLRIVSAGNLYPSYGVMMLQAIKNGGTDGVAQYSVNASKLLDTGTDIADPFSIEWRVRPGQVPADAWEAIVGLSTLVGGVTWDVDSAIAFTCHGDDNWQANGEDTGVPVNPDAWTLLKVILDPPGSSARFFIDDVLVSTQDVAYPSSFTAGVQMREPNTESGSAIQYVDWVNIEYPLDRSAPTP